MQVNVPHFEWRVLRLILRSPKKTLARSKTRVEMTRRSKTWGHIDFLVQAGLVQPVGPADAEDPKYTLTERGAAAAEHGVFDVEWAEYKTLTVTVRAATAATEDRPKVKPGRKTGAKTKAADE